MTRIIYAISRWFDAYAFSEKPEPGDANRTDWLRCLPFIGLHLGVLGVLWVGWSWTALGCAILLYFLRMFAITGFYHRYFSHRTFKTSRPVQFLLALCGNTAAQRGPLWWAAHHRHHHRHSDQPDDPHSPHHHGLWWSHVGWFTTRGSLGTNLRSVRDLARFPELVFLDRFNNLVPFLLVGVLFLLGATLQQLYPQLGTSGLQLVVWGFFVSTVVLFHATCAINSVAHTLGTRRYETRDESRNSLLLALLTLGEGWHNNHHHYPGATRQGFFWWEIDLTYYLLVAMERIGLIWQLNPVPDGVRHAGQRKVGP